MARVAREKLTKKEIRKRLEILKGCSVTEEEVRLHLKLMIGEIDSREFGRRIDMLNAAIMCQPDPF